MQRRPLQRRKMRYCLLQLYQERLPRRVVLFTGQNVNARAFILKLVSGVCRRIQ